MKIGYFLSSEENSPSDLVKQAKLATDAGFHALWISDHYHPWNDEQGHSGFVWSMIGAISQVTDLRVTTGVTCPTIRIHPAIIAQAAATSSVLLPGGFNLGVGSGEALNEHVLGDKWPEADVRLELLEEAVEVMRTLWQGGQQSPRGRTTRSRTHASTTCRMSRRRAGVRVRAEGAQPGREDRRRLRDDVARQGRDRVVPEHGGKGPVHAGTRSAYALAGGGAEDRVAAVAERGPAG